MVFSRQAGARSDSIRHQWLLTLPLQMLAFAFRTLRGPWPDAHAKARPASRVCAACAGDAACNAAGGHLRDRWRGLPFDERPKEESAAGGVDVGGATAVEAESSMEPALVGVALMKSASMWGAIAAPARRSRSSDGWPCALSRASSRFVRWRDWFEAITEFLPASAVTVEARGRSARRRRHKR